MRAVGCRLACRPRRFEPHPWQGWRGKPVAVIAVNRAEPGVGAHPVIPCGHDVLVVAAAREWTGPGSQTIGFADGRVDGEGCPLVRDPGEEQPGVGDAACQRGQHGSDEDLEPGVNVEYQHQTGCHQQDGCRGIGGDGVEHASEWLGRPV